jgi:DNA-binding protein HU-beta
MNKTELISSLVEETAINKKDIIKVLDALAIIVKRTLKKGDKVQLSGFGTFKISKRMSRRGVNPITKEIIQLPEYFVARFKPSKILKEYVKLIR